MMRGTYLIPCTLPIFKSLYPNVKINIRESASSSLEAMILSGETDLAFFNAPVKSREVDCEIISHEEMLLVMSIHHPLANSGIRREGYHYPWFDLTKLTDDIFILQEPGQRSRQVVDRVLQDLNILPQKPWLQATSTQEPNWPPKVMGRFCHRYPFETYELP